MPSAATNRSVVLVTNLLLVALLLPFLLASFYCHPHSDDFMNADFFKEHGFWYAQVKWYNGWTGRFVSVALQGLLSPLHYNFYFGYKLFPFVSIIAFWASIYYLLKELFQAYIAKSNILLLSLLFCAYFFIFLPGLADGIYWFTSNLGYFVPMILFSPFIVMLLRIVNGKNGLKENVLFVILGIVMIGSNELALIMVDSAVAFALLYKYLTAKKIDKLLLGLFLIFIAVSLFSILAPGNFHRSNYEGGEHKQNLFYTFYSALALGTYHLINYLLKTPLLPVLAVFYCIHKKRTQDVFGFKVNWLIIALAAAIVVSIYYLTFTPGTFAGLGNYSRILNITLFALLTGATLVALSSSIFINKAVKSFKATGVKEYVLYGSLALFFLFVFFSNNNLKMVVEDWRSGSLKIYGTQLSERLQLLEKSKGNSSVQIKQLSNIPKSIVDEHGKDVEINIRNYQQYFKIDTVRIY